jgi:PPP family 3-phenylpropionic acid transporter
MPPSLPRGAYQHSLAAGYFAYFTVVGVFTPYVSLWLSAQGYTPLVIGQLLALVALVRVVGPFVVASLFDHARSRRQWFVGVALVALGVWGVIAAQVSGWLPGAAAPMLPLAVLALLLAVYSLAFNSLMPLFDAYVLDCLGQARDDYGRLRWWGSAGFIVSSTLLGQWLARADTAVILEALLLTLLLTVACFLTLPADPPRRAPPAPTGVFLRALRQRVVVVFLAVQVLQLTGFGAYYTFFSLYLQRHGYGPAQIGLLWAWGVVAEIAVFLAAPWLVQRWRLRTLLQWALLGTALRWVLLATLVEHPAVVWASQSLHLAGFGLFHTVTVLLLPRLLPAGAAARAQALSGSLGWGVGGIAGSLLSAWLWTTAGPAVAFWGSALLAFAAALLAAVGLRGAAVDRVDPLPAESFNRGKFHG